MPENPQKARKGLEIKAPSISEGVGPAVPPDAALAPDDPEAAQERQRLERLGLSTADGQVRGVNIVADGVHAVSPVLMPPLQSPEEPQMTKMKINEYGLTMPARLLYAPIVRPSATPEPVDTPEEISQPESRPEDEFSPESK
jgi:hypothetical protein